MSHPHVDRSADEPKLRHPHLVPPSEPCPSRLAADGHLVYEGRCILCGHSTQPLTVAELGLALLAGALVSAVALWFAWAIYSWELP